MQPLMLIVPDVQDVYTPLQTDLIVPLTEVCISRHLVYDISYYFVNAQFSILSQDCKKFVLLLAQRDFFFLFFFPRFQCRQNLEQLLESIPNMFESNKVAESAFGAAIKVRDSDVLISQCRTVYFDILTTSTTRHIYNEDVLLWFFIYCSKFDTDSVYAYHCLSVYFDILTTSATCHRYNEYVHLWFFIYCSKFDTDSIYAYHCLYVFSLASWR